MANYSKWDKFSAALDDDGDDVEAGQATGGFTQTKMGSGVRVTRLDNAATVSHAKRSWRHEKGTAVDECVLVCCATSPPLECIPWQGITVDAHIRSSLRQVTIGGNDGIAIHAGTGGKPAAAAAKPKALPAPEQVCCTAAACVEQGGQDAEGGGRAKIGEESTKCRGSISREENYLEDGNAVAPTLVASSSERPRKESEFSNRIKRNPKHGAYTGRVATIAHG